MRRCLDGLVELGGVLGAGVKVLGRHGHLLEPTLGIVLGEVRALTSRTYSPVTGRSRKILIFFSPLGLRCGYRPVRQAAHWRHDSVHLGVVGYLQFQQIGFAMGDLVDHGSLEVDGRTMAPAPCKDLQSEDFATGGPGPEPQIPAIFLGAG